MSVAWFLMHDCLESQICVERLVGSMVNEFNISLIAMSFIKTAEIRAFMHVILGVSNMYR